MKALSVIIPCYNSSEYMTKSIDSCIRDDNVEIIIVNDGSSDATAQIADDYQRRHPDIVKAIHQKNKGHGGAINAGLQAASGKYIKILDSDDWFDAESYDKLLSALAGFLDGDCPDMVICNYVYEKVGKKRKMTVRYSHSFPTERIFTWEDVKPFRIGHYMLMHSIIYRRELLRECNLVLPEHTFYVDNLFAYVPLAKVEKMYYVDVDLYRYFIGRDDQSVQESIMIKRINQQLRVNRMMIDAYSFSSLQPIQKRRYMMHYLAIVTTVTTVLLLKGGTRGHLRKKQVLWREMAKKDIRMYRWLKRGVLGRGVNLRGPLGRKFVIMVYTVSQKIVGFN